MSNNKKYVSLARLSDFLENIKSKYSQIGHKHTIADLSDYRVDTALSPTSTNPVQNKVIDAEFDAMATAMGALELAIDGKSDSTHNHNDLYYTETEINQKLASKSDSTHNHDDKYDAKGASEDALTSAKSYTDTKTSNLASTTVVDNKVSSHNTSASSHSDIRDLITGLTTRLNTLANSDDTTLDQMSEVVAYIKNNKNLIDGITTNKVNVSDIVNNLTTNVSNKPLSAAQGVAIKNLIDALQEELDSHGHAISDVSGLQSALDGKAASSHGTHVSYSTTAPVMDGTASVGSASTVARSDHKHPTDTSRASKTEFDTHTADTTKHITATERTNWNAAKTHADSAHAPSNAEKNQNAFSNIKVGSTTVAADTATDTLELVGSNVTITPDATNDKITIAVASGSTSSAGILKLTNSTSSTSTTTAATPSSVKSAYDLANTAKTNAATAQSRADSAYTLAESKVDSLSDLGVTATATELNYLDGVTSNVQTQIDSIKDAKADWNQNDSTQLDYIKNRPFYETDPVETVIAEGTVLAGEQYGASAIVDFLTLGETYTVIFDDVTYSNLVCEDYYGLPTIGNNLFKFAIGNGAGMLIATNNSVSHSIKVIGNVSSVIPLERKYIAEYIDNLAGEKVRGKTYTIDNATVIAGEGAEVFNDYSDNIASGDYSHAGGYNTTASGHVSHAEGDTTTASGNFSHTEGARTTASGAWSHAEGYYSTASGQYSHAEGYSTVAASNGQHAQGKFNIVDNQNKYAHIVGNGTSSSNRSNIHTLDWNGNAWFDGNVYIGGTSQDDASKVVTEADKELLLPKVTTIDNGKFLRVVNGTWTASLISNAEEASF